MKKYILISTIFLFCISNVFSLDVPKIEARINDNANIISSNDERKLETLLKDVESKTSSQVALLTINSLQGENLEDYAMRVAQSWQLGQKKFDNGVLMLVAMKEKKIRIEVGYGLESIITDAKSGYIIRNYIVPEFKNGNFTGGITNGLLAISGLVTNEFEITDSELAQYSKQQKSGKRTQIPFGLFIFLFMFIFGGFRRRRGGLFTALFLGSLLGGGRSRGGGGFGGFSGGGGSFGGGGASGGW